MEARRVADAFAAGEVEKASAQVASVLQAHTQILHTLQAFLDDNQQLTKLVQDLPQKVSHSIMVPFGKAAFFPGRLVHTNEFLVLLGEGYYAECSASKTLDILDRRGNFLSSKIAGVNSQIADLDVEARFVSETLAEAAGGYVEIREEYEESESAASASNLELGRLQAPESDGASSIERITEGGVEGGSTSIEDKEHELLMARLDELEAAEAAVANRDVSNWSSSGDIADVEPLEHNRHQPIAKDRQKVADSGGKIQVLRANEPDRKGLSTNYGQVDEFAHRLGEPSKGRPRLQSPGDILKFEEWRMHTSREENWNQTAGAARSEASNLLATRNQTADVKGKASDLPVFQEKNADLKSEASNLPATLQPEEKLRMAPSSSTGTMKAFTGSVLERSGPSLLITPPQDEVPAPKRPASKFKMRQMKDQ